MVLVSVLKGTYEETEGLTRQYRSMVGNPRDFTPQKFSVASAIRQICDHLSLPSVVSSFLKSLMCDCVFWRASFCSSSRFFSAIRRRSCTIARTWLGGNCDGLDLYIWAKYLHSYLCVDSHAWVWHACQILHQNILRPINTLRIQ